MSKHTAGPWEARRIEKPQHPFEGGYEINLPGFGGLTPVALLPEVRRAANFTEQEANANLIAAAPEMLETLKSALAFFDERADADSNKRPFAEERLIAVELRAAIAKAEGR